MDYKEKLLVENKLHDASIISIKYVNYKFIFSVSCKGMGIKYYYPKLDAVIFEFECTSLYKLSFDFDGYICINDLSITDNDNRIVICVNDGDFYVECDNYTCKARPIGGYEEQNRKLDEFFKRNW